MKKGFTLLELLVSMTVTLVIIGLLVFVTNSAFTTLTEGENTSKRYHDGVASLEQLATDLEAIVFKPGNNFEWLAADVDTTDASENAPNGMGSFSSRLAFFTVAKDRYDGDVLNNAGDVSCVEYGVRFGDPIDVAGGTNPTFVLYRQLIDPDDAFQDLLNQADLISAVDANYSTLTNAENVLASNINQLNISFLVEYQNTTTNPSTTEYARIPVFSSGDPADDRYRGDQFSLTGNTITANSLPAGVNAADIADGVIKSIDINAQVLDPSVVPLLKLTNPPIEKLQQGITRFSRTIYVPQLN